MAPETCRRLKTTSACQLCSEAQPLDVKSATFPQIYFWAGAKSRSWTRSKDERLDDLLLGFSLQYKLRV